MAHYIDPFGDTARWMDQLFGSLREAQTSTPAAMPMDLYRAGDHYVMHLDLPGADPGSIDVNVEDRMLTIRAERTPRTEAEAQWLARERPSGTYVRQLTLGRGLAMDQVQASYADGVLTLTIPVAEEAKPRRVEVQHSGSASTLTAHRSDAADEDAQPQGSATAG